MRIAILLRKPYPPRHPRFQKRGLRAILRLERGAQRTGSRRQELLALHMNRRRERPTKSCGSPQTKLQFVFLPTIQLRRRRRPTSTFSVPRPTAIWAGGRGRTFDLHLENAHFCHRREAVRAENQGPSAANSPALQIGKPAASRRFCKPMPPKRRNCFRLWAIVGGEFGLLAVLCILQVADSTLPRMPGMPAMPAAIARAGGFRYSLPPPDPPPHALPYGAGTVKFRHVRIRPL